MTRRRGTGQDLAEPTSARFPLEFPSARRHVGRLAIERRGALAERRCHFGVDGLLRVRRLSAVCYCPTERGKRFFKPLIQLPVATVPALSFVNLVEAVATSIVAERYKAGESIDELARDYGCERGTVEEAVRCEPYLAA